MAVPTRTDDATNVRGKSWPSQPALIVATGPSGNARVSAGPEWAKAIAGPLNGSLAM